MFRTFAQNPNILNSQLDHNGIQHTGRVQLACPSFLRSDRVINHNSFTTLACLHFWYTYMIYIIPFLKHWIANCNIHVLLQQSNFASIGFLVLISLDPQWLEHPVASSITLPSLLAQKTGKFIVLKFQMSQFHRSNSYLTSPLNQKPKLQNVWTSEFLPFSKHPHHPRVGVRSFLRSNLPTTWQNLWKSQIRPKLRMSKLKKSPWTVVKLHFHFPEPLNKL